MPRIPIVIIHKGDSFYLKYCVEGIKRSNPDAAVFLLYEGTNETFAGVNKLHLLSFSKHSRELEKKYVHKNTSNPEIELFCLRRWLVLKDFMEKKKFNRVFTMDSDVLLFEDINSDAKNYEKFDVLLAKGVSAGLTFINSKKVLDEYCNLVLDFYTNKVGRIDYEANGTITDMSFWKELKKRNKFKVGELTTVIDNAVYDAGLLIEQNDFQRDGLEKVIVFKDKLPYAKSKTGFVRLKCLHCQGPTKFYMKYFLAGNLTRFGKLKVKLMMWLRDNVSPLFSISLRNFLKKQLVKFGF